MQPATSPSMFSHTYYHRVRFRECDPMQVVYHSHYIDYFEAARTEALREMGLPYKALQDSGVIMPVVDLAAKYHRSAFYDDMLAITSIIKTMPRVRIRIDYEVRRADEPEVLVVGHVTLCFFNTERQRPIAAPEPVVAVLAPFFDQKT